MSEKEMRELLQMLEAIDDTAAAHDILILKATLVRWLRLQNGIHRR